MSEFSGKKFYGFSLHNDPALSTTTRNFEFRYTRPEQLELAIQRVQQAEAKARARQQANAINKCAKGKKLPKDVVNPFQAKDPDIETRVSRIGARSRIRALSENEIEQLIGKARSCMELVENGTGITCRSHAMKHASDTSAPNAISSGSVHCSKNGSRMVSENSIKKPLEDVEELQEDVFEEKSCPTILGYAISEEQRLPQPKWVEIEEKPITYTYELSVLKESSESFVKRDSYKSACNKQSMQGKFLDELPSLLNANALSHSVRFPHQMMQHSTSHILASGKQFHTADLISLMNKMPSATTGSGSASVNCHSSSPNYYLEDSDAEYDIAGQAEYERYCNNRPRVDDMNDASMDSSMSTHFIEMEPRIPCMNLSFLKNASPLRYTEMTEETQIMEPEHQQRSVRKGKVLRKHNHDQQQKPKLSARDQKAPKGRNTHRGVGGGYDYVNDHCSTSHGRERECLHENANKSYRSNMQPNKRVEKRKEKETPLIKSPKSLKSRVGYSPRSPRSTAPASTTTSARTSAGDKSSLSTPRHKPLKSPKLVPRSATEKKSRIRLKAGGTSARLCDHKTKIRNLIISKSIEELKMEKVAMFSKMTATQERIVDNLDKIKMNLLEIYVPDSSYEKSRRQKNAFEFSVRFSRNFLYPLKGMIEHLRLTSAEHFNSAVSNDACSRVASIYGLINQSLHTYHRQLRYFLMDQVPQKLNTLIEMIYTSTNICLDKGIFDRQDAIIERLQERCIKFLGFLDDMHEERFLSARENFRKISVDKAHSNFDLKMFMNDLNMYEPKLVPKTPPVRTKRFRKIVKKSAKKATPFTAHEGSSELGVTKCTDDLIHTQIQSVMENGGSSLGGCTLNGGTSSVYLDSIPIVPQLTSSNAPSTSKMPKSVSATMLMPAIQRENAHESKTEQSTQQPIQSVAGTVDKAILEALQTVTKEQVRQVLEPIIQTLGTALDKRNTTQITEAILSAFNKQFFTQMKKEEDLNEIEQQHLEGTTEPAVKEKDKTTATAAVKQARKSRQRKIHEAAQRHKIEENEDVPCNEKKNNDIITNSKNVCNAKKEQKHSNSKSKESKNQTPHKSLNTPVRKKPSSAPIPKSTSYPAIQKITEKQSTCEQPTAILAACTVNRQPKSLILESDSETAQSTAASGTVARLPNDNLSSPRPLKYHPQSVTTKTYTEVETVESTEECFSIEEEECESTGETEAIRKDAKSFSTGTFLARWQVDCDETSDLDSDNATEIIINQLSNTSIDNQLIMNNKQLGAKKFPVKHFTTEVQKRNGSIPKQRVSAHTLARTSIISNSTKYLKPSMSRLSNKRTNSSSASAISSGISLPLKGIRSKKRRSPMFPPPPVPTVTPTSSARNRRTIKMESIDNISEINEILSKTDEKERAEMMNENREHQREINRANGSGDRLIGRRDSLTRTNENGVASVVECPVKLISNGAGGDGDDALPYYPPQKLNLPIGDKIYGALQRTPPSHRKQTSKPVKTVSQNKLYADEQSSEGNANVHDTIRVTCSDTSRSRKLKLPSENELILLADREMQQQYLPLPPNLMKNYAPTDSNTAQSYISRSTRTTNGDDGIIYGTDNNDGNDGSDEDSSACSVNMKAKSSNSSASVRSHLPAQSKSTKALNLNFDDLVRERDEFLKLCEKNRFYSNPNFDKPWTVFGRISDKIAYDIVGAIEDDFSNGVSKFVDDFLEMETHA